eukprot:UN15894
MLFNDFFSSSRTCLGSFELLSFKSLIIFCTTS